MGQRKTRPVTEMGRLVTRAQLQSAANQIGAHLIGGMQQIEEGMDARLTRIEQHLGLPPIDAKPQLVMEDGTAEITDAGRAAIELPEDAA